MVRSNKNYKPHYLNNDVSPIYLNISKFDSAKNYLLNPIGNGVWILNLKLGNKSGLTTHIAESLLKKYEIIKKKEDKKLFYMQRELGLFDYYYKKDKQSIHRLDIIFEIFLAYLGKKSLNNRPRLRYSFENSIIRNFDKNILKKYNKAIKIFEKEIYSKNFNSKIKELYVNIINKSLFILLQSNPDKNTYKFMSTEKKALESLKNFFEEIGEIEEGSLKIHYSPQKIVFSAYFYILESFYKSIEKNENIIMLIEESIDQFRKHKYAYAINNIGLIAEDYLHSIYETMFREEYPKGKTLGEINGALSSKTGDIFHGENTKRNSVLSFDELLVDIDTKVKQKKFTTREISIIEKQLILNIKKELKTIEMRINQTKGKGGMSIFPKKLRLNVKELIDNRNLVSHINKSLIRIGGFESLRSMYCVVTIIFWWNNILLNTDWSKEKRQIIVDIVNSHKNS